MRAVRAALARCGLFPQLDDGVTSREVLAGGIERNLVAIDGKGKRRASGDWEI